MHKISGRRKRNGRAADCETCAWKLAQANDAVNREARGPMRAELDKCLRPRRRVGRRSVIARAVGLACAFCVVVACARAGAAVQSTAPAQGTAPAQTTAPSEAGPPAPADSSGGNAAAAPADNSAPADAGKPKKEKKGKNDETAEIASWLMIDVVGGADKAPVAEASVYVRFTEVHKVGKDKKMEFDLKTNQEGVARAPDIPQGKVEIQIVAQGWASFGQYYDVEQDQQTIHIELVRPPRWY